MQIRIGIKSVPRELVIETDSTEEQVEHALTAAVADGGVFVLTNSNGGKVLVPADKVGYVEIGSSDPRKVGFYP